MKEKRMVKFDSQLQVEAYHFDGIMQKFPNHFHEYYVIGFIENGQRKLTCKNKDFIINKGDMVIFNPLDNHACEQVDLNALDYRCLNINADIMKKVAKEIMGVDYLPYFTSPVLVQTSFAPLLKEVHEMIMSTNEELEKEESFYFLMEHLIKKCSIKYEESTSTDERLHAVCRYMEKNYTEHLTLTDLAEVCDMNKYTLLRSFTRNFGITPYRYLQTIRINEAKKLLESGRKPIDVSMETGFADQSHFSNFFTEFIGLTPGQYREIYQHKKQA
ncbi:helix-turn-helix domain-containing protein [Niallia sp. FSL R7-0271]|uniref:helix-turn-helix domain-containing protein n=1 Tax=Niallia sp. FSL R7-0271 TaxID=2921678 RepID=UPI004048651B